VQVFISYGRQDAAAFAARLAIFLREQGYQPWLDVENGIRIGDPFDTRIEQGIASSQLLVALLSPWSLRPEGFCRNELLYAQAVKVPIVPMRIADVIPPIQIISLNYIDAPTHPEERLADLLKTVQEAAVTRTVGRREWPAVAGAPPWWTTLSRLTFEEELERHGGPFHGRDWLFREIQEWHRRADARLLLLTADAGVGKSAIAAQLSTRLDLRGLHFCVRADRESCQPAAWLRGLVYQLAALCPPYRREIEAKPGTDWTRPADELFRRLITAPLIACKGQLNVTEPWTLVIDGLDEALATAGPALPELLAEMCANNSIQPWWRLIVTSRPDQHILATFQVPNVEPRHLSSVEAANRTDVGAYIRSRLFSLPPELLPPAQALEAADRLDVLAAGNFLYAKMALAAVSDRNPQTRLTLDELGKLPPTLNGIYLEMFRKRYRPPRESESAAASAAASERYEQRLRPLLSCLAAARAPLPEPLLGAAAGLTQIPAAEGISELSQFLARGSGGIQLFHRSLADWLKDTTLSMPFSVAIHQGHAGLAQALWALLDQPNAEAAMREQIPLHLPIHLAEVNRWDDLLALLARPDLELMLRWVEKGEWQDGLRCLEGLVRHLEGDPKQRVTVAGLATQVARIHSLRGRYDEAERWLRRALREVTWWRGRRVCAIAWHELGSLHLYRGNYPQALAAYRKALRRCQWGWPPYLDEVSANLVGLATTTLAQLRLPATLKHARRALKAAEQAGDVRHRLAADRLIATVQRALGEYADAEQRIQMALLMAELAGVRLEKARLLGLKGWIQYDHATLDGKPPIEAAATFEEAIRESELIFHQHGVLDCRMSRGWCKLLQGTVAEARTELLRVKEELTPGLHPVLWAGTELGLAAVQHALGDLTAAAKGYEAVVESCRTQEMSAWWTKALVGVGAVQFHSGHAAEAERTWSEACRLALRISLHKRRLIQISIEACRKDPRTPPR
jgi:tetratricopeptide (TPR) repeat protein